MNTATKDVKIVHIVNIDTEDVKLVYIENTVIHL